MFVDASAIVAIITQEPGHESLSVALATGRPATSPLAIYEASLGVARIFASSPISARRQVQELLELFAVEILSMTEADGDAAVEAFDRFGKGRHPARLNMGDCFAYAMAVNRGLPLLFKGDDFGRTDIVPAVSDPIR